MFKNKISRRIIFSFLLLTTTSLAFLGIYLLQFFHQQNLESKTGDLITNAKIIGTSLESTLYDPAKHTMLIEAIRKISAASGLRITILNHSGDVAADSWGQADDLANHLDRQEIQGALHSDSATAVRYSTTVEQNMLYAAIPVYQGDRLVAIVRTAATLAPIEASYQSTRFFILSSLLVTIVFTLLAGAGLAHRHTKPIAVMTAAAKRIAEGELKLRIHIHTNDELELLAHTINQLTSNLEDKISLIDAEAKKLALILENMDNAVILLDRYGNITTANHRAKEIFHITPELMGKHSISVIGDSLLTETAQAVRTSRISRSINFKIKLNNASKTFQVFFAPLISQADTNNDVLSVFHDISVLQEIYERQVEFVANASHELATPLTAIRGFAETLLDGAIENQALSKKFVGIIHTESERMSRLISDLLQLAKLDSTEYCKQIKTEKIDLREIFSGIQMKLSPQLEQKRQHLQILLPAEEIIVQANYDWIMQLMVNLVENAIKYTANQGSIELTAWPDTDFICVSVKDNGSGIAPQDLPFIFERFYRADKARSRAAGGSGIGLSLVRFIVEMFGGKITATSQVNVGTTFTLSLPIPK